jgi:outer membrane lipoprotein SlyB
MNNRIYSFALAGLLALAGMGLSSAVAAQNQQYDRGNGNNDQNQICTYCGTVRSVTKISSQSKKNTGATVLGAVVGGVLGNQVGGGSGRAVATAAGAVAGGVIANNATKDKNRRTYYRINVRMDDGRIRDFDQGSSNGLKSGKRVEVHDGRVYPAGK